MTMKTNNTIKVTKVIHFIVTRYAVNRSLVTLVTAQRVTPVTDLCRGF
jgi:hypothetical protein